jgi:glycosyltransferase involved in cell wall biosynthesis
VPAAEVADELVGIGIAPADRFAVIPLGVDLSPFQVAPDRAAELREQVRGQLGIEDGARVATLVARLAPEKRVDRFLRVAERLLEVERARFLVVGDGALREQLQRSAPARALGARLVWAGQRTDMPAIYCASDVVALSSDREGAPVSLIEAQAAGVPVVSTDVGGVQRVVAAAHSGLLVARDDEPGFAAALAGLLEDADAARRLGENGRIHAARAFSLDRLADDVDRLYRRLLSGAAPG